jgi:peptide/nickel transport system substrate-binding protein
MLKKFAFPIIVILSMLLAACGGGTAAPAATATTAPAGVVAATDTVAAGVVAATDTVAAGVVAATNTVAPAASASKFSQAPMLDALVTSGKLPPVDQRLPADVFTVGPGVYMTKEALPNWQPGVYGGTLRGAHASANWAPDIFVAMNEPLLMAPKIGVQGIVGNVVKEFKVENNNQDFTFTMRKGLKWSDGQPVTSADVDFTWNDMYANDKLNPTGVPSMFRNGYAADGDPGKLTIVDDFTFKIQFTKPYGGFLRNLTIEGWKGYTDLINPSHFLKAYHIKYTSIDKMTDDLKRLNLTNGEWWQVFADKRCQNWDMTNPKCADYPGLYPWIPKASGSPSVLTWERNPYYFKVDTKGQQLPYIDKIISTQQDNVEMVNLKVMSGDVDFLRESTALVKMPLYKQNAAKAGFAVALMEMHVDSSNIMFNQTFDDKNWQTVVQDVRFRQAVSLAQNRQEMIDNVYYGYASVSAETVDPAMAKQDLAASNKLLDAMGLTKKDADGYRLYPDGSAMNILLTNGQQAPDLTPIADLVAANLKKVGIKVTVKAVDSTLQGTQQAANQMQMWVMWSHDRGWDNDVNDPSRAGQLYADWITSLGKKGTALPDWVKKAVDINTRRWSSVSGSDEYNAIVAEGLKWTRDNLPYVNLVEHVKYPMIVNAKLGNVPPSGAPAYAIGANFSIVQMFFNK